MSLLITYLPKLEALKMFQQPQSIPTEEQSVPFQTGLILLFLPFRVGLTERTVKSKFLEGEPLRSSRGVSARLRQSCSSGGGGGLQNPEATRDQRVGQTLGEAARANLRSPAAEQTAAAPRHAGLRAATPGAAGTAQPKLAVERRRPPAREEPRCRRHHPPPSPAGHAAPADRSPAHPTTPRLPRSPAAT